MNIEDPRIQQLLADFYKELTEILKEIPEAVEEDKKTEIDTKAFFDSVRGSLFGGSLKPSQVKGMEAKLNAFQEASFPLSWVAYALATSYHETAQRMMPVREGLSASDAWRKKNLRYYPYYGRGDVQLTWLENYKKADEKLGLNGELVKNLDLALDPDISAKIMVRGMQEGWFSGTRKVRYSLPVFLPDEVGTVEQFTQARRIINLMDKAGMIAGYAMKFQAGLSAAGYGRTD